MKLKKILAQRRGETSKTNKSLKTLVNFSKPQLMKS